MICHVVLFPMHLCKVLQSIDHGHIANKKSILLVTDHQLMFYSVGFHLVTVVSDVFQLQYDAMK
jgi:hypothetical protein